MNFAYRAKSTNGDLTTGVVEASSPAEARRLLREQGVFALSVEASSRDASAPTASGRSATRGITKGDLLTFTTEMAIMCRSGIDLAESLKNVARDCRNPALREVVQGVYDDVAAGASVSAAMQQRADVFGEAFVAGMAAGEASGRVNEVLAQQTELLRNEIRLRNSIRSVLAYPCVLLGVAILVLSSLVFFVLPQFSDVFVSLDAPPPATTRMLLDVAEFIRSNAISLALGVGALAMTGLHYSRAPSFRRAVDAWMLNSRLLRTAVRPLLTGRSFRLVGTMLESGLPLLESIRLARQSVGNVLFRDVFDRMEAEILRGNGVGPALAESDVVPPGAVQLVTAAERSGNLGSVMQLVGEFYEEEGEREIRQRAKILEPLIIVFMGVVVAFVVAAVMLPLLDASSSPT